MKNKCLLLFGSAAVIILMSCKKDSAVIQQPATENTTTFKVNFATTAASNSHSLTVHTTASASTSIRPCQQHGIERSGGM